jgi:Domain of unknown function (DUF4357)
MAGASIRIFLPDGNPDGVRLVYKSHWTGVALALPRSRYAEARVARGEFRTPGVYVLVGPANDPQHEARIYIGEGDDPRGRLDSHHAEKDFWTRLILFTSVGEGLNKATIRYLEARLLQLAEQAGRAELDNGNSPGLPPLSEADREDAEAFLADMLVIYQLLGVNFFEELEQAAFPVRLLLEGPSASAEGAEIDEGFVVFAGALARAQAVNSTPGWVADLRRSLIESGRLVRSDDGTSFQLMADYKFNSPSAAAATLLGRAAAGPLEWKDNAGTSLRDLRAATILTGT